MLCSSLTAALVIGLSGAIAAQTPVTGQSTPGQTTPGQKIPGQPAPREPAGPQVPPRPGAPARDGLVAPKGTSILRGHVVDARTGLPIRRARVTLLTQEMSAKSAQTDAEGRFELREVLAGKHTFEVFKTGYLSLVASNGGKRPPPLEVADGQTVEKIVVALSKGGVIAGQVLDEFGEPMVGSDVRVMRYRYVEGQRQLANVNQAYGNVVTDDLGSFRLHSLEPGDYFVVARPGRDFFGPSTANAEGPAQTFYPGTANPAEAKRVTVRAGRDTSGIVFPITVTRLSRVRGRALASSGEPFSGNISVSFRDPASGGSSSYGSSIRPDGTFEVVNLQPGTYVLTARPNNWRDGDGSEMGRTVLTVNGEDVEEVVLIGTQGGTARGRVVTDEGGPPPYVAKSFSLMAQPIDPQMSSFGPPKPVREDWTFEMTGLFDRVRLVPAGFTVAPGSSGPWTIKAVLVEGQDVTDSGIDFQSGRTVDGIEVVYTRKVSRVSGQVLNARGTAAEGWVILFPADETKWSPRSRYIRAVRPNPGGKYQQMPVPLDDYLIVGVTDIEDGQWMDPDFLRIVKPLATSLSIAEGETKALDVKIVEWRK